MGFFNWNNSNNNEGGNKEIISVNKFSVYFSDDLMFANMFYDKENITNEENFFKLFPKIPKNIAIDLLNDIEILVTEIITPKIENNLKDEILNNIPDDAAIIETDLLQAIAELYGIKLTKYPSPEEVFELLDRYVTELESGKVKPIPGIRPDDKIKKSEGTVKKERENSNNFSEDTAGFQLFKRFSSEIGTKYDKYITITM